MRIRPACLLRRHPKNRKAWAIRDHGGSVAGFSGSRLVRETVGGEHEGARRNRLKATGPKTPEGRERSSMTSLQHGMRSNKMALRRENSYAFENRLRKWTAQLDPRGDIGEFLVYRIGVASESCTILPSRAIKEASTSGGMGQRSGNRARRAAGDVCSARSYTQSRLRRDRAGEQVRRRTGGNRGFAATERHAVGRLFRAFLPPKPPTFLLVVGLCIADRYSRDHKLHRLPARPRPGHSEGHRRLLLSRRAVTLKNAVTSQVISLSLTDLGRSRNLGVNLGGGFQRRRASRL